MVRFTHSSDFIVIDNIPIFKNSCWWTINAGGIMSAWVAMKANQD